MNPRFQLRRGFTLVEIMAVVGLVGLLSSLAVAGITRVKHKTQDTLVVNALRQLYDAKELYLTLEGKSMASFTILSRQGYISRSMAAATEHNIGAWTTTALRTINFKAGDPVKVRERFVSGNHVTFGREIEYPDRQP